MAKRISCSPSFSLSHKGQISLHCICLQKQKTALDSNLRGKYAINEDNKYIHWQVDTWLCYISRIDENLLVNLNSKRQKNDLCIVLYETYEKATREKNLICHPFTFFICSFFFAKQNTLESKDNKQAIFSVRNYS